MLIKRNNILKPEHRVVYSDEVGNILSISASNQRKEVYAKIRPHDTYFTVKRLVFQYPYIPERKENIAGVTIPIDFHEKNKLRPEDLKMLQKSLDIIERWIKPGGIASYIFSDEKSLKNVTDAYIASISKEYMNNNYDKVSRCRTEEKQKIQKSVRTNLSEQLSKFYLKELQKFPEFASLQIN